MSRAWADISAKREFRTAAWLWKHGTAGETLRKGKTPDRDGLSHGHGTNAHSPSKKRENGNTRLIACNLQGRERATVGGFGESCAVQMEIKKSRMVQKGYP